MTTIILLITRDIFLNQNVVFLVHEDFFMVFDISKLT